MLPPRGDGRCGSRGLDCSAHSTHAARDEHARVAVEATPGPSGSRTPHQSPRQPVGNRVQLRSENRCGSRPVLRSVWPCGAGSEPIAGVGPGSLEKGAAQLCPLPGRARGVDLGDAMGVSKGLLNVVAGRGIGSGAEGIQPLIERGGRRDGSHLTLSLLGCSAMGYVEGSNSVASWQSRCSGSGRGS